MHSDESDTHTPVPDRETLLRFLRDHRLAVQASMGPGGPQAAVVGIAVSDDFEIVFDTLATTRKAVNLERDPHIALVIGGTRDGDQLTVQYEGIADRPEGSTLDSIRRLYLGVFPDGATRLDWPGITYIRVRPSWLRYSDYRGDPPLIVELSAAELSNLR